MLSMAELGSDEAKLFTLLKCYILYLEMNTMYAGANFTYAEEEKAATELEQIVCPYGEQPEGFRLYFWAIHAIAGARIKKEKWLKALPILLKLEKIYNRYMQSYGKVQAWGGNDYLKCIKLKLNPLVTTFDRDLSLLYNMLASYLFCVYGNLSPPDYENGLKYGVPKLRAIFQFGDFKAIYLFLDKCLEVIDAMIKGSAYKQADHILTVAMHQSVLLRRRLEPHERHEMNGRQGRLMLRFAKWGKTIADRSMQKIRGEKNVPEGRTEPYEELTKLMKAGREAYANQFPINLVATEEEVKKILKRARTWGKKGTNMLQTCQCECDVRINDEVEAVEKKYFK